MKNPWLENDYKKQMRQIGDHILMILGAPVVLIEMDKGQIICCIELAERIIDIAESDAGKTLFTRQEKLELLKIGGAAYAHLMLGRIRSIFMCASTEALLLQGLKEVNEFKACVTSHVK